MANDTEAATPAVAAAAPVASYDVKLRKRVTVQDFTYLPALHHVVDQSIKDAMEAEGAIADVKQLS